MYENILYLCLSLCLRSMVSLHPHSGENTPPLYGDYEAQRHWQEITLNTPIQEWYKNTSDNDLLYWGLDYPPLTAYHSYALGYVARKIDPRFVELRSSRGMETYEHKVFMRLTVLGADLLVYLLAVWMLARASNSLSQMSYSHTGAELFSQMGLLFYPGLILIDNGHFQYNNISLGFTIIATAFILQNRDCLASFCFVLALNYKQMELYHALPFFFYLLGKCWNQKSWMSSVWKLAKIGVTVIVTFVLVWWPFLQSLDVALQVVHRIFPIARGVFEDKVSNFWCALNMFIKIKDLYSSEDLAKLCLISTAILSLPNNIHLLCRPTTNNFLFGLVNTSMIFFLFSFQVHEKSILLVAIPLAVLLGCYNKHTRYSRFICVWFLTISTLSMFPLLQRDGLALPTISLSFLFIIICHAVGYLNTTTTSEEGGRTSLRGGRTSVKGGAGVPGGKSPKVKPLEQTAEKISKLMWIAFVLSVTLCVQLCGAIVFLKPPQMYPHIFPLLLSVFCAGHFILFSVYFHYLQFTQNTDFINTRMKLKKN